MYEHIIKHGIRQNQYPEVPTDHDKKFPASQKRAHDDCDGRLDTDPKRKFKPH